jgi:[protein-PII] uridylyltransferase
MQTFQDLQLFDPEQFDAELHQANSPIPLFKRILQQGNEEIKARFLRTYSAANAVAQRAWLVDQVLIRAWCWCGPCQYDTVSLLAVGGYGRGELHPGSDVDIMVLYEDMNPKTQEAVGTFLTFLWDIGLQVGSTVRSVDECQESARDDITIVTNLMETRLLSGSESLFKAMQAAIAPDKIWSSQAFFETKWEEQRLRHLKYHETAYNLEPNLKDGPGGLRDIQMIGWVAKRHFNVSTLHDLVFHGFLTEEEYQTLVKAQEFLWQVRCQLHAIATRREDRLVFDHQRSLAKAFGYKDSDHHLGVELFMREYYRTARKISTLNEMLLQLFHEAILTPKPDVIRPINRRFQVCNEYIEVVHDKVFIQYPFALLEVFLLVQQDKAIQGIRASTIRLILRHIDLVDSAFRSDLKNRSLFCEILRQPRGQTRAFRLMSRYEVLPAYLPAFGKISGRMQYDLFHVYTVDQHTLFVLRNLRRFALPKFANEMPLCHEVMNDLPKPELLYLAGLFHDIAKGRGGDHSELGQADAVDFCMLHGFSDQDARFVGWLVKQHLFMSVTVQREDIDDPDTVFRFAQRMGDLDHLNYLYLLTVADIRATSPKLWNGWKASLLASLYRKARQVLMEGLPHPIDKQTHIKEIKQQALRLLISVNREKIDALWENFQDEYFLRSAPVDIARETYMILERGEAVPQVIVRQEAHGGTGFLIYAQQHPDLFAKASHFLEQEDLNIASAYMITTESGALMLNFTVLESNGQPIRQEALENIRSGLCDTVQQDKEPDFCPIQRLSPRQIRNFPVPTRVTFSRDESNQYTLMEVITTDRPGVLSKISQVMMHCHVAVTSAKVATFGSRVEDIFFITDLHRAPLQASEQFDCLRDSLIEALDKVD